MSTPLGQARQDLIVIPMGRGNNEPEKRGLLDHGGWVVLVSGGSD